MAHKKHRPVVYIQNAAPEGAKCTSVQNAERFVAREEAEWVNKNTIRFFQKGEREAIQQEMAARARRMGEEEVTRRITQSRYGRASWGGSKRRGIPWFEREAMVPIAPGMVRS